MNIMILGPQGSGKGTQAKLLADKFSLYYFESGRFLRRLAKQNQRIDETINKKGRLIPDEEMFEYVKEELEENAPEADGIILDGYPRSIKQHKLLTNWLGGKGKDIDYAIFLDISEKETIRRLSARRIDKKTGRIYNLITNPPPADISKKDLEQRPDDREDAIKVRLEQYREQTEPLINLLRKKGILMEIDGERPIETIFEDISGRIRHGQE